MIFLYSVGPFKISLIGKNGVGKSTLMKFSGFEHFNANTKLTIGLDFYNYDYPIKSGNKNDLARFSIWVYNPERRFKQMFYYYLTGSHGIFIMFDVSNLNSLNEIDSWMRVIRKRCKHIPVMLLGNKSDLTEHLESAKVLAESIVKKYHLKGYYEISALESKNIELILTTMAKTFLKKHFPNLVKSI